MGPEGQKVMIIEDDLLLLLVEERLVKKLGYRVVGTASEGEVAISKIQHSSPDILIIDVNLKGEMNGIQIVQQLKEEGLEYPVIFLSGETKAQLVDEANDLGCVDYLLKPITANVLKRSLDKASASASVSAQNAA